MHWSRSDILQAYKDLNALACQFVRYSDGSCLGHSGFEIVRYRFVELSAMMMTHDDLEGQPLCLQWRVDDQTR